MNNPQIRQLKDFMEVYNKITETCFNHCITTFAQRSTSSDEANCADRCVNKYVGLNHQLMQVFVEIQPIIIQRKMEEVSKFQEIITDNNSTPTISQ